MNGAGDPIRERRVRVARLAELGKRFGYLLFGAALAVFVVGIATRFTPVVAGLVVGCLAAGSLLLLPSIVAGYAVKAAEREDRERGI